jgi:hypothetical protein
MNVKNGYDLEEVWRSNERSYESLLRKRFQGSVEILLVDRQALEEFCNESLKLGLEKTFERQKQILMGVCKQRFGAEIIHRGIIVSNGAENT